MGLSLRPRNFGALLLFLFTPLLSMPHVFLLFIGDRDSDDDDDDDAAATDDDDHDGDGMATAQNLAKSRHVQEVG